MNKGKEKPITIITTEQIPVITQTYSAEELKSKYPKIDFTTPPKEQPYNTKAFDGNKNIKTLSKILADKPKLDVSDNIKDIKLVCQGFYFEEIMEWVWYAS